MFGKKVCLLEKHSIAGGLNSYYRRPLPSENVGDERQFFKFDVGLHALTNFAKKGQKNAPLTKLLRQLRLSYDDLELQEQGHSLIDFGSEKLIFSNDFELLDMRHGAARMYAAGVITLGGPYVPVDSFLGLQYSAQRSVEHLVNEKAPALRPMNMFRSYAQWIKWVQGVAP